MPNRILREGILTSPRMSGGLEWPAPRSLSTAEEVLAVRAALPRLSAGDPRQAYKWELATRLRKLRAKAAGEVDRRVVARLFSAAGDVCSECHQTMAAGSKRRPTLDHRVALANGGTNEASNLRVICNRCNSRKADRA